MASESGNPVSVTVPDDLGTWLDEQAEEAGIDREELVRQLVAAYRTTAENEGTFDERVSTVVDARVSEVETDVEQMIDDVRKRVLQLKQEVEQKAPADHSHEGFERMDAVDRRLESVVEDLESLREDLDALAERTDETEDQLDDVYDKLVRVASAVVRLHDGDDGDDGNLSALRRAAAQAGVDGVTCDACEGTVHISLLAEAACPHCGTELADVEPGDWFFSSARVVSDRSTGSER